MQPQSSVPILALVAPFLAMPASSPTRISLKLRELNQLFNSMDPSPFIDRDLDHDAEEFIVSSARESPGAGAVELVIHLGTPPDAQRAAEVENAVRHYFSFRAELKAREFRRLLRQGHAVLGIGLLFLSVCLILSQVIARLVSPTPAEVLHEGFIIAGWVAMWRPLEIYLYEWWPVRQEWTDMQRLSRMHVRLILPHPKPAGAGLPPEGFTSASSDI